MTYKKIFNSIYSDEVWNNKDENIPKSGAGSSIENTMQITSFLDNVIKKYNIKIVTDLGCGDLTWMPHTPFFNNINYIGVDIVDSLIESHTIKYPNKTFICNDLVDYIPEETDLIIIRDVLFHLKNKDISKIFDNIRGKFKYICITTNNIHDNNDNLDRWHFAKRNIRISPFDINGFEIEKLEETVFDRCVLLFDIENFYKNKLTIK